MNYTQDTISDLADQFADIALDKRSLKRPPATYMCHLCFQKGHYIKDCPKVSANLRMRNFNSCDKKLGFWQIFKALLRFVLLFTRNLELVVWREFVTWSS